MHTLWFLMRCIFYIQVMSTVMTYFGPVGGDQGEKRKDGVCVDKQVIYLVIDCSDP